MSRTGGTGGPAAPSVWPARLVILVAFLDLFMQFPIVAPYARSLGASPLMVGVVTAAYSATNLIGNLVAGPFLDRWGRKRPVQMGLLMTAAALVACAVARTADQLLMARVVHGVSAAVLTPGAFAMIGDVAGVDRRARAMGINGALIAAAAMTGPPVAGILRDRLGAGVVFLLSATLMLVVAALFARWADDPGAVSPRLPATPSPGRRSPWSRPRLVAACLAALALTVSLGTLVTHLPVALAARGEPSGRTGLAFTVYAVVAMAVMAGPPSRWSDRSDRFVPLAGGLALVAVGMLVLGNARAMGGVAAGMAVFGLGFGLLFPSAAALVAEATERSERGAAFGIFYAVYSLGVVIGSVLSGALGSWIPSAAEGPFLLGSTTALLAVPALLLLRRRQAAQLAA